MSPTAETKSETSKRNDDTGVKEEKAEACSIKRIRLHSNCSTLDEHIDSNTTPDKKKQIQPKEKPRALITGINGQVGSYLAELLLEKGYHVHGMIRRESSLNSNRLRHLYDDRINRSSKNLNLHYGDLTDSHSLVKLVNNIRPHEVYNLAAQSHVKVSFEVAEMTGNTNALGTLRLLEAIRQSEILKESGDSQHFGIKLYQASTSELFGGSMHGVPQNEQTPFHPRSPYGCAKLYAHSLVVNYRESYGMFAVNGILFNHESPRRGENFVTRKISRSVAEIKLGRREYFELGNLEARRDWGHARDYVEAMWLMLQQREPQDFVIASGESHSVRDFVEEAFKVIDKQIKWMGNGLNEEAIDEKGIIRVKVCEKYFRPAEVDHLLGDASLAKKKLKWKPKTSFGCLVREMVLADIDLLRQNPAA